MRPVSATTILTASLLCAAPPALSQTPGPASNGNLDLRAAPQAGYRLLRTDEDWSFLRDPSKHRDLWDPIKYVPLNVSGSSYVSFGGESRVRYEYYSSVGFGRGPTDRDGYLLQRYLLHADAHLGTGARLFAQLGSSEEDGRAGGPRPFDRDTHDVVQLFADGRLSLSARESLTFRVGRQQMSFGSARLVGTGEGLNVLTRFDGARAILQTDRWRVDAFDTRPTASSYGVADGAGRYKRLLWGAYATNPTQFGLTNGLDVYYLDFKSRSETYTSGTGAEERRTGGVRLFGQNGAIDYNNEFLYQWGSFNGGNINAYSIQTDNGVTAKHWHLSPRLGLRLDMATGDKDPTGRNLQTYNPLFVAPNYYNQSSLAGVRNFVDVHPTLDLHPAKTVDVLLDWDFFWRESLKDGLYGPTGAGVLAAANGSEAKFVGSTPDVQVSWNVDRHVSLLANYSRFYPGGFLRDNHLDKTVDYVTTWVDYKF